MNRFGSRLFDQPTHRLKPFAMLRLHKGAPVWVSSLRVLCAHGPEGDRLYFLQKIFNLLILRGFVSLNARLFWYSKGIIFHRLDIPPTSRGQKQLDWLPVFGAPEMHLETRAIPFLAGPRASAWLVSRELRVVEAAIGTHRKRQTIKPIDIMALQGLPDRRSKLEPEAEERLPTMESA